MGNKILLINPSYNPSYGGTKAAIVNPVAPTLGLATIAATALEKGNKVEILDMSWRSYDFELVRNKIIRYKPDIVGVTATTPLMNQMRDISVLVKDISKNILVVGGGPHTSALPEESLRESKLDAVLVGEADYTFAEISDGHTLADIKGLVYRNNDKYDACTPLTDDYIAAIKSALDENGLSDNTLLVIISDHGTSLGEKYGEKFYGVFAYEYTINVFCMLNHPKLEPKVVTQQCRTIDLYPTILELTGIENTLTLQIQGESLMKLVDDDSSKDRVIFVETGGLYGPWPSPWKHNVFCIKTKNKKLIYNDEPETWEFYDLEKDPGEENNIYDKDSDIVNDLKEQLLKHFKENNINTKISLN